MQNTTSPTKKLKIQSSQNYNSRSMDSEKLVDLQQQKLVKNQQKIAQLQQKVSKLKQQRAKKIHQLDTVQTQLRECKQHRQMLPLIQQLREHYKKLKQQLGSKFYVEVEQDDVDVDQMSYQQLLELGEKIGKVSKGLSQEQFSKLDKIVCSTDTQQCSICQDKIALGTQCIKLKCGHLYDSLCLQQWFKMQKVCPLCKSQSI